MMDKVQKSGNPRYYTPSTKICLQRNLVVIENVCVPVRETELTAWSRVLSEKLMVAQLVKKFSDVMHLKVHYRIHKSPPLVSPETH
jgi:hypothetical protein